MSTPQKTTIVRMPANEKLYPAHIAAIRPDIDNTDAKRGDYVLSIQTPSGTRDATMPANGTVKINVTLMQDLEPKTALFTVTQVAEAPAPPPETPSPPPETPSPPSETPAPPSETPAPPLEVPAPPSEVPAPFPEDRAPAVTPGQPKLVPERESPYPTAEKRKWGISSLVLCLSALGLAALLPGILFATFDDRAEMSVPFFAIATGLCLILIVLVWLLSKLWIFSARPTGGVTIALSVLVFGGALGLGIWFPEVRSAQERTTEPLNKLARVQLEPVIKYIEASQSQPTPTAKQEIISLPAGEPLAGVFSDPKLGEIMLVGFNFCPRGWAPANGAEMPISLNSALFSLLGTNYGGDGRTSFRLPDLRGRAPIHITARESGFGNDIGRLGGSQTVRLESGSKEVRVGTPNLAMNYCIALEGTFPSRN